MDVFETRRLTHTDDKGTETELVLIVPMPVEVEVQGEKERSWKCMCIFEPHVSRWEPNPAITDFLGALENALTLAAIRLKSKADGLYGRVRWQGMTDCGLPEYTKESVEWESVQIPRSEPMLEGVEVLATRRLLYPNDSDDEARLLLTVFVPFREGETWKCGVTFGPPFSLGVYYGIGDDRIEALLDALATARAIYEQRLPKAWTWRDRAGCIDFPYKIGRSFRKEAPPDETDTERAERLASMTSGHNL